MIETDYSQFIESKRIITSDSGFMVNELSPLMFPFQEDLTKWSLRKGRSAIFADCGLGKTIIELEWSQKVADETGGNVLILAPLAVSKQTVREGEKFGYKVNLCRTQDDVKPGINITNYEMLQHFNPPEFVGVVPDESSILKGMNSKTRLLITESFANTPYKLACTATPAPNDYMELGNHAEFLGVMTRSEMLAMFFVHDGGDTSKWRIKGHAEQRFWEWVSSWAVVIRKPSDLGYENDGFSLPKLNINQVTVITDQPIEGMLFAIEAKTLQERQAARKSSVSDRVARCAELVNESPEQWIIWCNLNAESEALRKSIDGSVEVRGSDSSDHKEKVINDFVKGNVKILISKPSIFGFGLNLQNCHNMAFVGLSDSYEEFYQAVRRCWRFGQKNDVNVHVITANTEGAVVANIERKERDAMTMINEMVKHTQKITSAEVRGTRREQTNYIPSQSIILPEWLGVKNIV